MQRALIAGLLSSVVLGWLGVYVTSRKMSFIGDGIAHASLAAIAIAVLMHWSTIPVALVFSVCAATCLYFIEKKKIIAQDTAIGILFTASLALGVVLLQFNDGYVPELVSYLFGNILAVHTFDLVLLGVFSIIIFYVLSVYQRQLLFSTIDAEGAYLANIKKDLFEYLLYVLTSIAIVLSVKLVGIVLVSGLLILPSAIAKNVSNSFAQFQIFSIIMSILVVFIGLFGSYVLDIPSGASIILTATIFFIPTLFIKK